MKVVRHDRLDAVGARSWDTLLAASRCRSPFRSRLWHDEWVRAFAAERALAIWAIEDDAGQLLGLLPLYEEKPGLFRSIGGVEVSDYLDLIAIRDREVDAWTALLAARRTTDTWELHAVPADSPTVTALPALALGYGLSAATAVEERCPVLALPASWDAYLAGLPGKHRHELLRKIRRLEREAPDAHVACAREAADVERRLDDFLELHRQSRPGKARFMDGPMAEFFRRVTRELAGRGAVGLWFLEVGGAPVASFITFEWDGTVGLYNSGFLPEYARWSPGLVLLAQLVRDAIERGHSRFDFLRGEERYKYEFGPEPEDVYAVTIAMAGSGPRG